jgi:geranylgeranyl diphosphate synthase type II
MEKLLNLLNQTLEEHINTIDNIELKEASTYALFPGGKRLRPLFLLLVLEDLGIDYNIGIYPAMAVELIHTYSLIHDDLPAMDNDDFRRGKPSLHKKFGEALAILTADAFLSDAFRYFLKSLISSEQKLELIELASISSGSSGMVLGQVLDLKTDEADLEKVKKIHLHKTTDLFKLSILGGGIIAGLNLAAKKDLEELAFHFGSAFQIKDDLEDYREFSDLEKITYPNAVGFDESNRHLQEHKKKSLQIARRILGEHLLYHLIERIL